MDAQVRADGGTRRHLAQHGYFEDFRPAQRLGQAYAPRLVWRDIDVTGLAQGGDVLRATLREAKPKRVAISARLGG